MINDKGGRSSVTWYGAQASPGNFQQHVEGEQNPHHYVFLMLHLELQDPNVDSRQEAYVREQVCAPASIVTCQRTNTTNDEG